MSGVPVWLISKSSAISAPSGSLLDAAYLVRVTRGSWMRDVIVEFADSSSVVSNGYAEEVTRRYLADDEPPRHLVVEVSTNVRVVAGPGDDNEPAALRTGVQDVAGGRARARRRGHQS